MLDLILRYAMDVFVAIMTFAFFMLYTFDLRQSRKLPVPEYFVAALKSGRYYLCMSWITLFFAAHFLFTYQEPALQPVGILFFIISFLYFLLYCRRIVTNGRRR
jgi:hypothetical protein